jgi:hypothetical protein
MSGRRFPIMGGPSVPWELVAPYEVQAKQNHDQTLERLAERGGLAPNELWCVVKGLPWRVVREVPEASALAWLKGWLSEHEGVVAEVKQSFDEEEQFLERLLVEIGDRIEELRRLRG